MKNCNEKRSEKGQALITLLFFTVIATIVTSAAVVIIVTNAQSTSKTELGTDAYYVAESGAENGVIRLLRDPLYTGETLTVGTDTTVVTVTGAGPYTLTSTGTSGTFVRKIQVVLAYTNNILTITSWKEIP